MRVEHGPFGKMHERRDRLGILVLSRNCATPLTAYYAQKENDYGNETYRRIQAGSR